jgi:hypothetical protein
MTIADKPYGDEAPGRTARQHGRVVRLADGSRRRRTGPDREAVVTPPTRDTREGTGFEEECHRRVFDQIVGLDVGT